MGIQNKTWICKFEKKMRLLIFLTFTATVLSGTGVKAGQNYTCPETDMQFGQDFIDEVVGVADWHGCGHLCETNEECRFWSFGPADIVKTACFLLTQESMLHDSKGWVSGAKDCQ